MPDAVPPLRCDLDLVQVEHDGRAMVLVRDHLGLVPEDRVFSLELFRVLGSLGPGATLDDLGQGLSRAARGEEVSEEQVRSLVQGLDELFLLQSPALDKAKRAALDRWQALEVRPPALSGLAYPADPGQLRTWADGLLGSAARAESSPVCLVAPHIDPQAGARVYASAYGALGPDAPERVVVLGTGHNLDTGLVSLCRKDFETPLGVSATDRDAAALLARAAGESLAQDDFTHRSEHSVEFQALFLQHVYGPENLRLVPVLLGSGHSLPEYSRTAFLDALGPFCRQLAGLLKGGDTLLLLAADLTHIGPKFGHATTADMLEPVATTHETRLLEALADLDADALWRESASVGDGFHVCSFLSLAVAAEILARLGRVRGRLLDRDLWFEEPTQSAVGFAALAFDRT